MGKRESIKGILEEGLPDKTVKSIIDQAAPDNVVAKVLNLGGGVGEHVIEAPVNFVNRIISRAGSWMRSRTRDSL